jgi:hypothetical protein
MASLFLVAAAANADDLKLKDGSKITGTIVGFDDNSFKVQTSYGFALVLKSQVVSISISDTATTVADKQPLPNADEKTVSHPASPSLTLMTGSAAPAEPASATHTSPPAKPQRSIPPVSPANPAPKPVPSEAVVIAPAITAKSGASGTPVLADVATAPTAPPRPGPIREEVNGGTYVNETYGFRMYKPPSWEVIAGGPALMPGAIAAMGTNDQTTYLLIGEAPAGKSLASDIDATDQRLRSLLNNFRPLGESHVNVSGTQAIERRFRGTVDEKDWSGTVVFLARDGELYTIFGMTLAETDLVQIQENVIARAISSLQFTQ